MPSVPEMFSAFSHFDNNDFGHDDGQLVMVMAGN